jgi:hypothetical protein
MTEIDDDTFALLTKRVYDMAGTVKGVKVFLDGTRIKIDSFKKYIDMYTSSASEAAAEGGGAAEKIAVIYEAIQPPKKTDEVRWEIGFALSTEQQFQQVSFVNRISTTKGGTHVDDMANQIANRLAEHVDKKNKGAKVKAPQIKHHMWLFVNAMVENPAFDSQTKECLNTKKSQFGSKPVLSEEFFKKGAPPIPIPDKTAGTQLTASRPVCRQSSSRASSTTSSRGPSSSSTRTSRRRTRASASGPFWASPSRPTRPPSADAAFFSHSAGLPASSS